MSIAADIPNIEREHPAVLNFENDPLTVPSFPSPLDSHILVPVPSAQERPVVLGTDLPYDGYIDCRSSQIKVFGSFAPFFQRRDGGGYSVKKGGTIVDSGTTFVYMGKRCHRITNFNFKGIIYCLHMGQIVAVHDENLQLIEPGHPNYPW